LTPCPRRRPVVRCCAFGGAGCHDIDVSQARGRHLHNGDVRAGRGTSINEVADRAVATIDPGGRVAAEAMI